jgi:hypothetical protein
MFNSPLTVFGVQLGKFLVYLGVAFQVAGFYTIRRIADIKV